MSRYLKYEDARAFVRKLKLKSQTEWQAYVLCKPPHAQYVNAKGKSLPYIPKTIPSYVHVIYRRTGEWTNWQDFLGLTAKDQKYLPYEQAREKVRKLKLKNHASWHKWYDKHKPKNIPKNPDHYIGKGTWVNWADFLGTKNYYSITGKEMKLPLMQARKYVHKMRFEKIVQYDRWWKENRPLFLPFRPEVTYKEQWGGWKDFIGVSIYSRMQLLTIDISVLYITHNPKNPDNVYEIAVESKGELEVYEKVSKSNHQLIRLFEYDSDQVPAVRAIMQQNCTYWWQGGQNIYVVPNLYQLMSDLSMVLKWITTKSQR